MKPIYNIDITKLVYMLLTPRLLYVIYFNWLLALLQPLRDLQNKFHTLVDETEYELSHNGQICYLQAVLNDYFDSINRRIKIKDGNRFNRVFIYTENEQKPLYLYTVNEQKPVYLYKDAEYGDSGFDFYVELNGVTISANDKARMQSLIDYYKLASMRYDIVN